MNMPSSHKPFTKKWGKQLVYWNGKLEEETKEAVKIYAAEQTTLAGVTISQGKVVNDQLLSNRRIRQIANEIKRSKSNATKNQPTTTSQL